MDGAAVGDQWKKIVIVLNGNSSNQTTQIPNGNWKYVLKDGKFDEVNSGKTSGGRINVPGIEMMILVQE